MNLREWYWERLLYLTAALGIAILAIVSNAPSARSASPAGASEPLWFAKCELQAERYIVCSVADQRVNEYLSQNATLPAGIAFGQYVADYFSAKGCIVGSINDGLRVNGIFYSWDTKALGLVSCRGTPLRLTFQPDRMMISEFVSLYLSDRPSRER